MKKESFVTNEEKATKRSVELSQCRRAKIAHDKLKGYYVYCPETKTEVFIRQGRDQEAVLSRHIKYFFKQRYSTNFGKVPMD